MLVDTSGHLSDLESLQTQESSNRLCRNTDLLSFSLHSYSTYNATHGKACVQQPRHTWPGWPSDAFLDGLMLFSFSLR